MQHDNSPLTAFDINGKQRRHSPPVARSLWSLMGYYTNGFVLTSPPDFDAISAVVGRTCLVGYKHKDSDLWLLDIWMPRKRRPHTPFCDPVPKEIETGPLLISSASTTFLETLDRLRDLLSGFIPPADSRSIELALAIAAATSAPVFYFAAGDELTDLACQTIPGEIVAFGCRLGEVSIQYGRGRIEVAPLRFAEYADEGMAQDVVEILQKLRGISLAPTVDVEGGLRLYENPLRHWPAEAGNATEILGLGTWDPFANFEARFEAVFARAVS